MMITNKQRERDQAKCADMRDVIKAALREPRYTDAQQLVTAAVAPRVQSNSAQRAFPVPDFSIALISGSICYTTVKC
jgi:hypothetical protein